MISQVELKVIKNLQKLLHHSPGYLDVVEIMNILSLNTFLGNSLLFELTWRQNARATWCEVKQTFSKYRPVLTVRETSFLQKKFDYVLKNLLI